MPDYDQALANLVQSLEKTGLTYALGGATALAVWAEPRATMDVDVTLWCQPEDFEHVFATLEEQGAEVPAQAVQQALQDGVAYLRWEGIRLDVFVPSIPFYEQAKHMRERIHLPDVGETWVLSATALCVFKLLFFRPKDLVDVAKLLSIADVDRDIVRKSIVETVGSEDERVAWWDANAS